MQLKQKLKRSVSFLAVLLICILFGSTALGADSKSTTKNYTISSLKLTYDSSTGQVKATWNATVKTTDKVVMLYLDGVLVAQEKASGVNFDFSEYVAACGEGTYSCSVYPVKLGSEYTKDSNTLEIDEEKLKKVNAFRPDAYAFEVSGLSYDEKKGSIVGSWYYGDKSSPAKVLLMKGTTVVDTWKSATGTSYDFTDLIAQKGAGTYTFKIYPVRIGDNYTEVSGEFEVTAAMVKSLKVTATEKKKSEEASRIGWFHNGPTNIWYYYKTAGVKASKEWIQLDGKTYHFTSAGIMQIGWQVIDGYFYYFDKDGALQRNTTVDGYQLNEKGQRLSDAGEVVSAKGEKEAPAVPATLTSCTVTVTESTKDGAGNIKNCTFKAQTGFTIESTAFGTEPEDWKPGTPVSVTLVVVAGTNYSFGTGVKFTVRGCKSISSSGTAQRRTVTFNYYPKMQLVAPDFIYLNGTEAICWRTVESAARYKVVITEDGTQLMNKTVTANQISIADSVTISEDTTVTVKIYSMSDTSSTSWLLTSAAVTISNLYEFAKTNTIQGELTWNSIGLRYLDETGEKYYGWAKLFDNWYYFKKTGYAAGPGWMKDDNDHWYYFDSEHRMCTGWVNDGTGEYFMNDGSVTNLPLGAWVKAMEKK